MLGLHSCRALSPQPQDKLSTKFECCQEPKCRTPTKLKPQVGDFEPPKGTYFDPGWSLLKRPVTVVDRARLGTGRSGYQWTRKVAGKTVTIALSREHYQGLKQAIKNERSLWKTIGQMERLSRQILFATTPDTRRRKPLDQSVLGLI